MTIDDQIRNEKLQYDLNREAAKISALSSGKTDKYEYLTGEDVLPSNQQQIIEQAKFTYSSLGNVFEKKPKTIEDQGKKQVDALESLKPKPIADKSSNLSKAAIIFNELINKRKELMSELYDRGDYNNLKFEYVDKIIDVSIYEYKDSKELFNMIKNSQIKFSKAKNKQNEFLKKLNEVKMGNKAIEQRETISNLEKFYKSREEVINLFRDYIEMLSDENYNARKNETEEKGLNILTSKQIKAGNNSENLLNEITQIVYSLYQSKQITKKVYNNLTKPL